MVFNSAFEGLKRYWKLRFHRRRRISRPAEWLLLIKKDFA